MLLRSLVQLTTNAFSAMNEVPLPLLISDRFLQKHTNFSDLEEFLALSGHRAITVYDLDCASEELTVIIQENSSFLSWSHMKDTALDEFFRAYPYGILSNY